MGNHDYCMIWAHSQQNVSNIVQQINTNNKMLHFHYSTLCKYHITPASPCWNIVHFLKWCCPRAKWHAKSYLSLHICPQMLHWKGCSYPWHPMWMVYRILSPKWTSQCWHLCKSCWSVGRLPSLSVKESSKLSSCAGLQLPLAELGESFKGGEVWTSVEDWVCSW